MVSVQKKLQGTNDVLGAFTIDNGMAIGSKKSGDCIVEAIVTIYGSEDCTVNLVINQDKLAELKGKVIYKNLKDSLPR